MNRLSRLPVRSSNLLDPGSSRKSQISRNDGKRARASSSSRVSNSLYLPHSLRRSQSSASLRRTPQSCQTIRNKSADRQKIKKKDNRPINDKKWQSDMLAQTQKYFQNDPQGAMILNQGKSLRPITINMFVQLENVVLQNIDLTFEDITTKNYVQLLPKFLTMLMYPGAVTPSMLKTANTMHSWPHILAILSWLIGLQIRLMEIKSAFEETIYAVPENLSEKEILDLKIQQFESQLKLDHFIKWNKGKEVNDFETRYSTGLKEIYNFSQEAADNLKSSYEILTKQTEIEDEHIQSSNNEIIKKKREVEKLIEKKRYITDVVKQQEDFIKNMEAKIKDIRKDNKILREEDEKSKLKNAELEEKIKNQPMTQNERDNNLQEIEEMRIKKAYLSKEREHQQKISDEADIRLSQMKRNLAKKVSGWNLELMEPALKHPKLKDFICKNDKFLMPEFYEDVKEKIQMVKKLDSDLNTVFDHVKNETEAVQTELNKIQAKFNNIEQQKHVLETKRNEKQFMLEEEQKKVDEQEQKITDLTKFLKNKILEDKNSFPNFQKIKDEIDLKTRECNALKVKVKNKTDEMVTIFEKLEEEIKRNIVPKHQAMRNNISEAVIRQHENLEFVKM